RYLRVDQDPSPRGLNGGRDRSGDSGGATDGIPPALEVMLGDDGMHREATLSGRQTVGEELRGEHADQLLVVRQALQHLPRCAVGMSQEGRPQRAPAEPRKQWRDRFVDEIEAAFSYGGTHELDVAIDRSAIRWEVPLQALAKAFDSGNKIVR